MRWFLPIPNYYLLQKLETIVAKIDELHAKVDELETKVGELQATLDAEQMQITAAIAELNQTIVDLQGQIGGASDVAIQAVIDRISSVTANLATAKADLEGTV